MKINDRYEIRVVVIEIQNGTTGDVYDNFEEFKKEHPFSSYKFGFVVFDTKYGYTPDNCNDWNDSPEEAMFDYEDNCKNADVRSDREVKDEDAQQFKVKIPNGYLMVEEKGSESEYPGVYVSFSEDGKVFDASKMIACVEYDSCSKEIITAVYRKEFDDPHCIIRYRDGRDVT